MAFTLSLNSTPHQHCPHSLLLPNQQLSPHQPAKKGAELTKNSKRKVPPRYSSSSDDSGIEHNHETMVKNSKSCTSTKSTTKAICKQSQRQQVPPTNYLLQYPSITSFQLVENDGNIHS
jgi:hypothetical protein